MKLLLAGSVFGNVASATSLYSRYFKNFEILFLQDTPERLLQ